MFVGKSGVEHLVAALPIWAHSRHVPGFRVESVCMCGEGCPARSARELVAAISRSVAARVFLPAVLGYWLVVGEGFPPSFFVAAGVPLCFGKRWRSGASV